MRYKCNFAKIITALCTGLLLFQSICFAQNTEELFIESPSAILIHKNTGTVLYEKNAYTQMYPASTTKIMTAILVLESSNSLSDVAVVSESALIGITNAYSNASLKVGEQFTLEQLLNVLLISSANDAANVLAEHISGSISAFADLMNKKALDIGCTSTHFVNPSGIHSNDHYSTAYDLSLIAKYAMQNTTFCSLVCKTSCSLPATDKYPYDDRTFSNTNALLNSDSSYYYPYANGIKTGFTTPAGSCLVASSSNNELEYIVVVLGSVENNELSQRYSDTIKLFNFAYVNYSINILQNENDIVGNIEIAHATSDTKNLKILSSENISAFIELNSEIVSEIKLKDNLAAPIKKGDSVGKITYNILGISYEANLIAGNDVKRETLTPLFTKIIMGTISFLIIIGIFFVKRKPVVEEIDLLK